LTRTGSSPNWFLSDMSPQINQLRRFYRV